MEDIVGRIDKDIVQEGEAGLQRNLQFLYGFAFLHLLCLFELVATNDHSGITYRRKEQLFGHLSQTKAETSVGIGHCGHIGSTHMHLHISQPPAIVMVGDNAAQGHKHTVLRHEGARQQKQ